MANFTQIAGRQSTNTFPAWRTAMTQTDRLYYVGTKAPTDAPGLPGMPTQYGQTAPGVYGAAWEVISGYSSGTYLEDEGGPFGVMVNGTGGHNRVQNQMLGFNLNQDDPAFYWFQQPTWKTSDTGGAEFYYSPSEQAALIAGPRGLAAFIENPTGYGESFESVARWDRQFPVAYNGWIFPRKMTTGQMGDNVPHGLRYATQCYIPARVTGSDPLMLALMGPQGPFVQSHICINSTESDWFDASVLVSGARRWPYYFKNLRTGAWSLHQWQPLGIGRGGFANIPSGCFPDLKRVYILSDANSQNGYYYLDFSAGYTGHTQSAFIGGHLGVHRYSNAAFSIGDVRGRHYAVTLSNSTSHTTKLVVYDFDAGTSFHIDLAATGFSYAVDDSWLDISFDAANQRVILVQRNASNWKPEYWSITIPATLTDAGGWSATLRTLTLNDAAMNTTHFDQRDDRAVTIYGKSQYLPRLGVCFFFFGNQRPLVFRPSP